jgi:hypothetical protein
MTVTLEEYIERLKAEDAEAYLELGRDAEVAYMEEHSYRFERVLDAIPHSRNPIRILDIGTTPFTFFLKEANPHYLIATVDLTDLMESRSTTDGFTATATSGSTP